MHTPSPTKQKNICPSRHAKPLLLKKWIVLISQKKIQLAKLTPKIYEHSFLDEDTFHELQSKEYHFAPPAKEPLTVFFFFFWNGYVLKECERERKRTKNIIISTLILVFPFKLHFFERQFRPHNTYSKREREREERKKERKKKKPMCVE